MESQGLVRWRLNQCGTLTGSYLADPTDWSTNSTAAGYVSIGIGDANDPITGLFGFFDMLLIGKRNNIYKLYGAPATDADSLKSTPCIQRVRIMLDLRVNGQ